MAWGNKSKTKSKDNWVFAETIISNGKPIDLYINTKPTKNMVYFIAEKDVDGSMKIIKGDTFNYLKKLYQDIIKTERAKYLIHVKYHN
ncbi:MAG: hypothetical protein QW478_05225 [Candidatus Micrarchaeaceae archaeon]